MAEETIQSRASPESELAQFRETIYDPGSMSWEQIEIQEDEFNELKANPPRQPSFPFFVFTIAVLKDLSDFVTLGFAGILFNIFAWIVIRLWLFGRLNFIKRWLWKKFITRLILEFIPVINMFPWWTFFVLRGYFKEKEQINKIIEAFEKFALAQYAR